MDGWSVDVHPPGGYPAHHPRRVGCAVRDRLEAVRYQLLRHAHREMMMMMMTTTMFTSRRRGGRGGGIGSRGGGGGGGGVGVGVGREEVPAEEAHDVGVPRPAALQRGSSHVIHKHVRIINDVNNALPGARRTMTKKTLPKTWRGAHAPRTPPARWRRD